jgi:pimeloyl-ACP methyl ester carboxylesterase
MSSPVVTKKFIETRSGRIAYLDSGSSDLPVALLVHGIPTSSFLWRKVMRALEGRLRCLAPDLMGLGDTAVDPRTTDFSMPSQATMLEDFLDAHGVAQAHLVAHDQGGAAAQILVTNREKRVRRLVLTDCVCFDNWPVPVVRNLMRFARLPFADVASRIGLMEFVETRTPMSRFRRGVVNRAAFTDEAIAEYLRPLRGTPERARFLAFLLAGSPRYTMAVVPRLRELRIPTLVLWAAQDTYIPVAWGQRLYETIPGARRLDVIDGAGHFWPEEKPEPFADRIGDFLLEAPAASPSPQVPEPVADLVAVERLTRNKCATAPAKKASKSTAKEGSR